MWACDLSIPLHAVAADAAYEALHFQHAEGRQHARHGQAAAVDHVVDDAHFVADCGEDGLLLRIELQFDRMADLATVVTFRRRRERAMSFFGTTIFL